MINNKIYTVKVTPIISNPAPFNNIIEKNGVDAHYFLSESQSKKYEYLRGAKKILRKNKNGHEYIYSEGSMSPYDDLSLPARTMLTSEGTTNRTTHIVIDPKENKLRILTPVECERINQFPDNRTNSGMSEKRRYFMMGNALVWDNQKTWYRNLYNHKQRALKTLASYWFLPYNLILSKQTVSICVTIFLG